MQFQYQTVFEPIVVAQAPLPVIVEPCYPDYIEPVPFVYEGITTFAVVAFAEYDGITYFIGQDNFELVKAFEVTEQFGPVLVPAATVAPTFYEFVGVDYPELLTNQGISEIFNAPVVPLSTFVKNWGVESEDWIEPKPDYSDYQSVFECRRPLPVPGAAVNLSLIEYYNLTVRLDVKKAVDSGTVVAVSTDVSGTPVTFNKAFKDVDSVTATVQEVTGFIVVVDFVDVPNPTGFSVYVFDRATGARATKTVYWAARGII